MNTYYKDPSANLDFQFNWSAWLSEEETISTAVIAITPAGKLTSTAPSIYSGVVTIWLSGGDDSSIYTVACKITTNQTRVDERSILVSCFNR